MKYNRVNQPGTPLPWNTAGPNGYTVWAEHKIIFQAARPRENNAKNVADAAFIVHACNAYPRLIAALLALTETGHTPEDREQKLREAHTKADDLLEELGEFH